MDIPNTCCFIGHRKLPADKLETILVNLDREIDGLIARGVRNFITGGVTGFDIMAAHFIVAKKEMGKSIRLLFALPCKNHDADWDEKQKELYQNLLNEADEVLYVSDEYDPFRIKRRNQYMIAHSEYCICALLHEKSGTGQTVRLARKKGLKIINVAK